MKKERRFIPVEDVEFREDAEGPKIAGYSARFNVWTDIGGMFMERIAPGAFTDTIQADDVRALFNHDPNMVLGRTTNGTLRLSEDRKGLFMEDVPPETSAGKDVLELIRRGDVTGQSFGFSVLEDKWEAERDFDGVKREARTIKKARLYDVGPVTFPAYEQTDVSVRSAQEVYEEHRQQEAPGGPESDGDGEAAGRTHTPQMTSMGNALALREHEQEMGRVS